MSGPPADASALTGRRVLVLGTTGFIGRWVAREASRAGARVWAVARDGGLARRIAMAYGADVTVAECDVLDEAGLAAVVRDVRPEVTFNLVGYGVDRRETDADRAEAINVDLVRRLLALVRAHGRSADWPGLELVHTGSALEYGAVGGHLSEDAVVNPTTVYGKTKLAATEAVAEASSAGLVKAVTARLFTVYGPGEHQGRLLPSILAARSLTSPVPMTNGLQQRDFTYVGDVAEGLIRAAGQRSAPWTTVNLATGRLHSVRAFVTEAERALALPAGRFLFGALPSRPEEMAHAEVTVERARQWLGWVPGTGIAEGVRATDRFLASLPNVDQP
ncbi:MAG: NAD-dependent epimerase/dehydratase [Vicinamibacterales bacterium]